MVRDRRRYAMLSSPFMVAYGNLLIVLQYIWSFETMEPKPGFSVRKDNPFHSLSSKVTIPQRLLLNRGISVELMLESWCSVVGLKDPKSLFVSSF